MSRMLPMLAATSALALAAFTLPIVPVYAAAPFDGTWIIDVPADRLTPNDAEATCPALRLQVQIADNQVSGEFRRAYPEPQNVIENGGINKASQVTGQVQPGGGVTAEWQDFHAAGKLIGPDAGLTVQTSCGPLMATAYRLDNDTTEVASSSSSMSPASSEAQTASSTTASRRDGYNVYFSFDKSRLTVKGREVVDAAVKATQGDQTSRIALLGKADLSGTDPYNMALSHRRADTVRNAMVAGGVPADRIDVRWVGEREPPVPTANGVRDAKNRVVEVAID
jgi:outer membrane protein OmpA-like peptidoglycan-associated protein